MHPTQFYSGDGLQRGAALVTALVIMLALMVVGVSAARTALHAEKSARGERDRTIAFQAAEAALPRAPCCSLQTMHKALQRDAAPRPM